MLGRVNKGNQSLGRVALQQVFVQTDAHSAHATWKAVAGQLEDSITRLLDAVLAEQNEDWLLQNRYMPQQSMLEIDLGADDNDVIDALASQRITQTLPDRKAGSEFTCIR